MVNSLLSFIRFTTEFEKVARVVRIPGEERWENDAEHSYQLALVGWYLVETRRFEMDAGRVIALALVHDLVEAYAGDTYIYGSESALQSKAAREEAAMKRLEEEFPEFGDLHRLIREYEERQSPEAKFVYALDKLLPILNIYVDDGRTWREKDITLDMLKSVKKDKVSLSPEIQEYYVSIVEELETKPHLFRR